MDKSMSKDNSIMFQGLAVLMMLFHHFFTKPANLTLLHFNNEMFVMRFAWLCKLCVVIFAFISGYGMNAGENSSKRPSLGLLYKKAFTRILKLYLSLWLVIAVTKCIDFFLLHQPISGVQLILNCLGLSYTYNGTWWYVLFYALICLIFPLIRLLLTKDISIVKKIIGICITAFCIFLLYQLSLHVLFPYLFTGLMFIYVSLHPPILFAFIIGIIVSELRLLDKIKKIMDRKYLMLFPALVILFIISYIRWKLADSAAYCTWDFVMIFPLVISIMIILNCLPFLQKLFVFFGKHSTTMWLTHSLTMAYTYVFIAAYIKSIIPFFIAEVIVCFLFSYALDSIKKFLRF